MTLPDISDLLLEFCRWKWSQPLFPGGVRAEDFKGATFDAFHVEQIARFLREHKEQDNDPA